MTESKSAMDTVVDPARMQDLINSLGDDLRDVIESYLEDAPVQMAQIQSAWARGDLEELQGVAHSLKSSSGIFGARQVVEACRSLEISSPSCLEDIESHVKALPELFEKVRHVLNLYRGC